MGIGSKKDMKKKSEILRNLFQPVLRILIEKKQIYEITSAQNFLEQFNLIIVCVVQLIWIDIRIKSWLIRPSLGPLCYRAVTKLSSYITGYPDAINRVTSWESSYCLLAQ